MKTIRNVLFASMLLFAFSCEKESDVTGIEESQAFESFKGFEESGININEHKRSLPNVKTTAS